MGADLLIHTLMWDKKRKLDFKAGHRVIDEMDDDDDSLKASGYPHRGKAEEKCCSK